MVILLKRTSWNCNIWFFNRPGDFERDDVEFKENVDFNKLGYPEFYKLLHQHTSCTCRSASARSSIDTEKQVLQLLLRYNLLCSGKPTDTDDLLKIDIKDGEGCGIYFQIVFSWLREEYIFIFFSFQWSLSWLYHCIQMIALLVYAWWCY